MKARIITILLVMVAVAIITMYVLQTDVAQSEDGHGYLFVTATELNGRTKPKRTGFIQTTFLQGQPLQPTGRWSRNKQWLEVYCTGEVETVWVNAQYVSERIDPFYAENVSGGRVKIRNTPFGSRITGYLQNGKKVQIDQVIQGWGRCSKGWINLLYLEEVVNE